mmetsp:Transcript_4692/g.3201  ORF Transcript_4692/g.3201 Transcript_4692/m.3201 type:complete len:90 (-) Transcript_4692:266-535(-)
MEKIMQRFTSFTNVMSSNNSNNDDNENNDDDNDDDVLRDRSNSEDEKKIDVVLPEDNNKVDSEFADGTYWRVDSNPDDDLLDELLADYE